MVGWGDVVGGGERGGAKRRRERRGRGRVRGRGRSGGGGGGGAHDGIRRVSLSSPADACTELTERLGD